eukprot:jgi/Bigna1/139695/aug1.52_g14403
MAASGFGLVSASMGAVVMRDPRHVATTTAATATATTATSADAAAGDKDADDDADGHGEKNEVGEREGRRGIVENQSPSCLLWSCHFKWSEEEEEKERGLGEEKKGDGWVKIVAFGGSLLRFC